MKLFCLGHIEKYPWRLPLFPLKFWAITLNSWRELLFISSNFLWKVNQVYNFLYHITKHHRHQGKEIFSFYFNLFKSSKLFWGFLSCAKLYFHAFNRIWAPWWVYSGLVWLRGLKLRPRKKSKIFPLSIY